MVDRNKGDGVIDGLLPKVAVEELRDFVQKYARRDAAFSVALGQWLMEKHARLVNDAGAYIEEVRKLFCLTDDSCRSYYRNRYDDIVLDWDGIDAGMEKLVETLRGKLAEGAHEVVVPPVLEFYRQFIKHYDDFGMVDEANVDAAAEACDTLLLEWAAHPDVPAAEKKAVYRTLQGLADHEELEYTNGLTSDFFLNYLTLTQTPEEALASIEKMEAEGKSTPALVHKHISLLRQFGREAEALKVIQRNVNYHSVLDAELERLYQRREDYAALNLIDLALASSRTDSQLLERKVRFLKRLKDTAGLITVYRGILLERWDGFEYYHKLKKMVPESEWPEQYRLIVAEACRLRKGTVFMARLYAAEKDYPALNQALLTTHYDLLELLQKYLKQLPEEYHEALLNKGLDELKRIASLANKRTEYANVAARIRSFAKLPGAGSMAALLAAGIRTAFARRSAYLDELAKKGL